VHAKGRDPVKDPGPVHHVSAAHQPVLRRFQLFEHGFDEVVVFLSNLCQLPLPTPPNFFAPIFLPKS